ncbi:hypothetical protein CAS74_002432 [Pichia kudriavzevii]|uniref:Uncharacterized protein n=1 Tax=Pichia kudriavzevii TaxID=4909 RepID=A0A1Z8JQ10_PICKU|nr:hypothetical protein CAS74_002432 [Pichia kudriavzevii]
MVYQIGRTRTPAILSTTGATIGWDKNGPMTGIDLKNWTRVAKNSPNKASIPNVSTTNPINGRLERMRMIPIAKASVPRIFSGLVKKYRVFCGPIIRQIPTKKSILAIDSKPASKKDIIPRKKSRAPAEVKKTPNFCV